MKYKITMWFDESVDELLDILEEYNIDYQLEEVQDNKEEL
jgi:hypothetical protein